MGPPRRLGGKISNPLPRVPGAGDQDRGGVRREGEEAGPPPLRFRWRRGTRRGAEADVQGPERPDGPEVAAGERAQDRRGLRTLEGQAQVVRGEGPELRGREGRA